MTIIFSSLIGLNLTCIEFLHDYFQLVFENGSILNIFNRSSLESITQFEIDKFINCRVMMVVLEDQMVKINFSSGSQITISLLDEAYNGPEAIEFINEKGELTVI